MSSFSSPSQLQVGFASTDFGSVVVASSSDQLGAVLFAETSQWPAVLTLLRRQFEGSVFRRDDNTAAQWANEIFSARGPANVSQDRLILRGTGFQISVWQALLKIPFGGTSTYGQIATSIGLTKAARAVGRAVGTNCLAVVIPCHRVICQNGSIGGYRFGVERKRALLEFERNTIERQVSLHS